MVPVSAHLDAGSTSDVNRLPYHQEASGHGTVLVRLQRGDDGQGVGKWRGVAGLGPHDTITSATPHAIEDTTAKPIAHGNANGVRRFQKLKAGTTEATRSE